MKLRLLTAGIAGLTGLVLMEHRGPDMIAGASRTARYNTDPPVIDPAAPAPGGGTPLPAAPTVEQLQAELAAEKAERERIAADHKDLAKKIKDHEDSQKSDADKRADELKAAQDRVTLMEQKAARRDVLEAMKAAGVVDPELAYLAVKDRVEIKDGEPVNTSKLVEAFVKERPAMVKPVTPDTKPNNPAGGSNADDNDSRPGRPAGRI